MPSLTLKNIPEDVLRRLRAQAAARRRSVNSEAIALLESGLQATPVDPERLLAWIRSARVTPRRPVSDQLLTRARQAGRL
jgi:plasmid stability protein